MKTKECSIIYGGRREERRKYAQEFVFSKPDYVVQVRTELQHPKKRLFGKYSSTLDILMKHRMTKNLGKTYVKEQMGELELYNYLDRSPITLSEKQRILLSMFLDVQDGRKNFFLWDEDKLTTKDIMTFLFWLRKHDKNSGIKRNIIWLTGEMKEAFLEPVFTQLNGQSYEELASSPLELSIFGMGKGFFQLVDGKPVEDNTAELFESICKEIGDKKLSELNNALRLTELGAYKEAASVYQQLIFHNDPVAMRELARLYMEHFESKDWEIERLLKTASTKYEDIDAFVLYADYEMKKGINQKDTKRKYDYLAKAYHKYIFVIKSEAPIDTDCSKKADTCLAKIMAEAGTDCIKPLIQNGKSESFIKDVVWHQKLKSVLAPMVVQELVLWNGDLVRKIIKEVYVDEKWDYSKFMD